MATVKQVIPAHLSRVVLPFPTNNDTKALAANTAESFTAPAGAWAVRLACTVGFWASTTGTAAVGTDISDGTGSVYVPSEIVFLIPAGATLSVLAASNSAISASWYTKF